MIQRPPRSTRVRSSAASDVYKRQELVNLLYQGNAVGIIAMGRNASHLAEQLAAKVFVPVIAISADSALTAVNLPWIFRLPAGAVLEDAVGAMAAAAER